MTYASNLSPISDAELEKIKASITRSKKANKRVIISKPSKVLHDIGRVGSDGIRRSS